MKHILKTNYKCLLNQINLNEYHVVNSLKIQGKHEKLTQAWTHTCLASQSFSYGVENLIKDKVNLNNKGNEFTPKWGLELENNLELKIN
jgi:hypothetical protein